MVKLGRGRWLNGALGLLAAACSPLRAFNRVVPKDGGVQLVARDARFGGDPRQRLDLYAPRGRAGVLPVIVFLYGGSWSSGDEERAMRSSGGRSPRAASWSRSRTTGWCRRCGSRHFLQDNAAAVRWIRVACGGGRR